MYNKPTSLNYLNSGINKFFSRSIMNNSSTTLQEVSQVAGSNEINFDRTPTSGSLGDKIQVGGVIIDGVNRRIAIQDESGVEVGWIGNLDD